MAKKKGQTPPRTVRDQSRGRPGQIRPTADRAKKRRRANLITGLVLLVIVGAAVTAAVITVNKKDGEVPGLATDTAPWPAEIRGLSRRLDSLDLPDFREGPGAYHIHSHVDVFVNGNRTPIPATIGNGSGFLSAVHTHDDTGLIHVEADSEAVVTLGMVFDIWGVRFNGNCIGGYCTDDGFDIEVHVDGEKIDGPLRDHALEDLQQIAVVIGTPPDEIPDTYDFADNPTIPTITPTPIASGSASPTPSATSS